MTSRHPSDPQCSSSTHQVKAYGFPFTINRSASIIFRLSRPRTWVFPSISLILGYTSVGGGSLQRLLIGIMSACLVTASTNLVNAFADRREDLMNQPSRALWLEKIGPFEALVVAFALYAIAGTVSLLLGPLFMLILGLGILDSLFYSLPPLRFKANPIRSLVSFSGAVGLAFLGGMSINGLIDIFNPFFLLCTYFMFAYGAVKNLPDYRGDKRASIKTSATIFPTIRDAVIVGSVLLFTPYLLLVGLVFAGVVGTIYLLDLGFVVILSLIIREMSLTMTPEGLEKAHTIGFFYAISFLVFTLVLMSPTLLTLVIVLGAYAWTLLVSKVKVDSRAERRDWETTINN